MPCQSFLSQIGHALFLCLSDGIVKSVFRSSDKTKSFGQFITDKLSAEVILLYVTNCPLLSFYNIAVSIKICQQDGIYLWLLYYRANHLLVTQACLRAVVVLKISIFCSRYSLFKCASKHN